MLFIRYAGIDESAISSADRVCCSQEITISYHHHPHWHCWSAVKMVLSTTAKLAVVGRDIADIRISETEAWHTSSTLIGQIQNLSNRRGAFWICPMSVGEMYHASVSEIRISAIPTAGDRRCECSYRRLNERSHDSRFRWTVSPPATTTAFSCSATSRPSRTARFRQHCERPSWMWPSTIWNVRRINDHILFVCETWAAWRDFCCFHGSADRYFVGSRRGWILNTLVASRNWNCSAVC